MPEPTSNPGHCVPVGVGVGVGVFVAVGVGVGAPPQTNLTPKPLVTVPAVLHANWGKALPVSRWTPSVERLPVWATSPQIKSIRFVDSYSRTSKLARVVLAPKYTVRHSMLKMRLGAVPEVEVKMPHTPPG